jgi:hypothetical protein
LKIVHKTRVFWPKKRYELKGWNKGKMVENKGFCVPRLVVLGDKTGAPPGGSETLALPCFGLPIFRAFWGGFLILNAGFGPQIHTDSRHELHEFSPMELAFVCAIHLRPFFLFPFAFLLRASGHFSREREIVSVRHYRYFFTISQQKPEKRNFGGKFFLQQGHEGAKADKT